MIHLNIDLSALISLKEELEPGIKKALSDAARDLSLQAHAHIVEKVQEKLHSTRERYLAALSYEQVDDSTWIINLDKSALWIEEGLPEHNMLDNLLKSKKARTAKDGCVLNPRNKVLTSLGWKRIKDVVPGDLVLTHSGKYREVKELLVKPTDLGTEFVNFRIYAADGTGRNGPLSKANSDLTLPSLSLTVDHPVLTPGGWKSAGDLKNGDFVATPADLKRLCKWCQAPLPINAPLVTTCLNNRCARQLACAEKRIFNFSAEDRKKNGHKANLAAKASGIFNRLDWGARNPDVLQKMRTGSAAAMRARQRDGQWAPELCFEQALESFGLKRGVDFLREEPLPTDRVVNAGRGRTRKSVLFLDFFFPALKLVVELDGKVWHNKPEAKERDRAKDRACKDRGYRVLRIPSHKIYRRAARLSKYINLWLKNHSGELGVAWVKIGALRRGKVLRRDHIYAKKYDICLDAEEHSFCCETVFIHNSRYLVVPFQHNKGPTQQTKAAQDLTATIKRELQQRKIAYNKIETDAAGRPKLGLLHKFDIKNMPLKTVEGPGQGHGPIGAVRQGNTGIPFLSGIRIYQKQIKDGMGRSKVSRSIMTFRVASSKHYGSGKWEHPGTDARRFFDEAADWALRLWETQIAPRVLDAAVKNL